MTYEEYYDAIKEVLKIHLVGFKLSDEQIDAYMKQNEDMIKSEYKIDNEEYESGKITLNVFKNGAVNGVAWCLRWMYE